MTSTSGNNDVTCSNLLSKRNGSQHSGCDYTIAIGYTVLAVCVTITDGGNADIAGAIYLPSA
ncbi:hypothetical protein [Paraglaciecola sp. 20A4]|uniref:hypothetical protein n=1 Tax=Paraglaciecola sp. 20A4 TaxID=2687288 RepID=UPI00140E0EDD|nr:hypothetical protein [Paraglaciecola sp. 20A4]